MERRDAVSSRTDQRWRVIELGFRSRLELLPINVHSQVPHKSIIAQGSHDHYATHLAVGMRMANRRQWQV